MRVNLRTHAVQVALAFRDQRLLAQQGMTRRFGSSTPEFHIGQRSTQLDFQTLELGTQRCLLRAMAVQVRPRLDQSSLVTGKILFQGHACCLLGRQQCLALGEHLLPSSQLLLAIRKHQLVLRERMLQLGAVRLQAADIATERQRLVA